VKSGKISSKGFKTKGDKRRFRESIFSYSFSSPRRRLVSQLEMTTGRGTGKRYERNRGGEKQSGQMKKEVP